MLNRLSQLERQLETVPSEDEQEHVYFGRNLRLLRFQPTNPHSIAFIPLALPDCLPPPYLTYFSSPLAQSHLHWIAQKESLEQDIFLMGPPGPTRLALILYYAYLTHRPVYYVPITRDTTESDLLVRRILKNNTTEYQEQACLSAARNGGLLVLDGIERAERNLLVILNNLLEARELFLEDGRILRVLQPNENDKVSNVIPMDPRFRVVALGVPVPRFAGQSLDPPFRSRFQARFIDAMNLDHSLIKEMRRLADSSEHRQTQFPTWPDNEALIENDLSGFYPFMEMFQAVGLQAPSTWRRIWETLKISFTSSNQLISHFTLILGGKNSGKHFLLNQSFSNYATLHLHEDWTLRDLFQRFTTDANTGDTIWIDSLLLTAAKLGQVLVLEGVERAPIGLIDALMRLQLDQCMTLPDGKVLMSQKRATLVNQPHVIPIHPSFTMIGLMRLDKDILPQMQKLTGILPSWKCIVLPEMTFDKMKIICNPMKEEKINDLFDKIEYLMKIDEKIKLHIRETLTLRVMQRLIQKWNTGIYSIHALLRQVLLIELLPKSLRELLEQNLIVAENELPMFELNENEIKVKNISFPRRKPLDPNTRNMIPRPHFIDNPSHLRLLTALLHDFALGHDLLLLGNQGVGKNRVCDRLLFLLQRPRRYIQLHRDSSIYSLTALQELVNGKIIVRDSVLVEAVKAGHVLVIDEADKAPVSVSVILQSLLVRREMTLSDGRRIVRSLNRTPQNVIVCHPEFRMILLANRFGFPFAGNDFFKYLGDAVSAHVCVAPDPVSELALIQSYGPHVHEDLLKTLIQVFSQLRQLADQQQLIYPFSTRELVQIVRHLNQFHNVVDALWNVFDFDVMEPESMKLIMKVCHEHGIPLVERNVAFQLKISEKGSSKHERKATFKGEKIHVDYTKDKLGAQGTWQIPSQSFIIEKQSMRLSIFSRLVFTFQLPSPIVSISSNQSEIIVITNAPLTVFVLNEKSNSARSFSLQEFSSSPFESASSFKDKIAIVLKKRVLLLSSGTLTGFTINEGMRFISLEQEHLLMMDLNGKLLYWNLLNFEQITININHPIHAFMLPNNLMLIQLNETQFITFHLSDSTFIYNVDSELKLLRSHFVQSKNHPLGYFVLNQTLTYFVLYEMSLISYCSPFLFVRMNDKFCCMKNDEIIELDDFDSRLIGACCLNEFCYAAESNGTIRVYEWGDLEVSFTSWQQMTGFQVSKEVDSEFNRKLPQHRQSFTKQEANELKERSSPKQNLIDAKLLELHQQHLQQALQSVMSKEQIQYYIDRNESVQPWIQPLHFLLQSSALQQKKRIWMSNQLMGEMDPSKLAQSRVGEKKIYKRRIETNELDFNRKLHFCLLIDISASMFRFNNVDGRLDRTLECLLLLIYVFERLPLGILDVIGHSGENAWIPLLMGSQGERLPSTMEEKFQFLHKLFVHAQHCLSGDHTVMALERATQQVPEDAFILLFSDANLSQYKFDMEHFKQLLLKRPNTHFLLMGQWREQAEKWTRQLPFSHVVKESNKELMDVIQRILVEAVHAKSV